MEDRRLGAHEHMFAKRVSRRSTVKCRRSGLTSVSSVGTCDAAAAAAMADRIAVVEPLLRIDHVSKHYPGVIALDDLTVEVPRRIGLVGANGAGKTTTFRLLLGLAHPTKGRIEVCGADVADDPIGVRSRLGYMPEHDCLPLDQTAADVVSTFGEAQRAPGAGRPPAGVRHPRPGRPRRGSLPADQGVLHGDAPAHQARPGAGRRSRAGAPRRTDGGARPARSRGDARLVARLGTFGISVLMATHLLDDVQQVCDHVVMIDAGRLVVSGATDSLLERTGVVTVDVGPRGDELVAAWPPGSCRRSATRASSRSPSTGTTTSTPSRRRGRARPSLYRLSARLTTLDEVFLHRAGSMG